jgi:hypothetical protein
VSPLDDTQLQNTKEIDGTQPAPRDALEAEMMMKHVAASLGAVLMTSSMAFAGQSGLPNTGTTPASPGVSAPQSDQAATKAAKHKAKKHRKHHKKSADPAKAAPPKQ